MLANFKRSIGAFAALSALTWAGGVANAQTLSAVVTQYPTGPGQQAKVKLTVSDNTAPIAGAYFAVAFDAVEADITGANYLWTGSQPSWAVNGQPAVGFDANGVQETDDEPALNTPLTHFKVVEASHGYTGTSTLSPELWPANGDIIELTFTMTGDYDGTFEFEILEYNGSELQTSNGNSISDISGVAVTNPGTVYDAPVIGTNGVAPDGTWISNATAELTITGSGFYDGGTDPQSTVYFNGTALDMSGATITYNQIQVDVPQSLLAAAGTAAPVNVHVQNSNTATLSGNEAFYVVNRETVYVDDHFTQGEGVLVSGTAPYKVKGANAFDNIDEGVDKVEDGTLADVNSVIVADGDYEELVTINKNHIELVAEDASLPKPSIKAPSTAENDAVVSLLGQNIKVDGFAIDVNRPDAVVGISAKGVKSTVNNIKIYNNDITVSGSGGSATIKELTAFGNNWIAGIAVHGTADHQCIVADIKGNNVGTAANPFPGFALQMERGAGTIGGPLPGDRNSFFGIEFDAHTRYLGYNGTASNPETLNIVNNLFGGVGNDNNKGAQVEVGEPNGGLVTITDNDFEPLADTASGSVHRRSLQVKNYLNDDITKAVKIIGNRFKVRNTGLALTNSGSAKVTGNDFTAVEDDVLLLEVNNRVYGSSVATQLYNRSVIESNAFVDGGKADVTGISFRDHSQYVETTFDVTLGGAAALANSFASGLAQYIELDEATGPTSADSRYAGIGVAYSSNMVPFAQNLDATQNLFAGVRGTLFTVPQGFSAENKISHKLDVLALGFVRTTPDHVYVTPESGSIANGVAAADAVLPKDTVNVKGSATAYTEDNVQITKSMTVVGHQTAGEDATMSPAGGTATGGTDGFIVKASDVTIQDMNIHGVDSARRYSTAVYRGHEMTYNTTILSGLSIKHAGHWSANATTGKKRPAVLLSQAAADAASIGNSITECVFEDCDFAGIQLSSGVTTVEDNDFTQMLYQGIVVTPRIVTDFVTEAYATGQNPTITASLNEFTNTEVGIRMVGSTALSNLSQNTFNLGTFEGWHPSTSAWKPNIGIQVEYDPVTVNDNDFVVAATPTQGNHFGVWLFNLGAPATVSNNTFSNLGTARNATAIALVGQRTGNLAGSTGNDADTRATISGNSIDSYARGVVLEKSDTTDRETIATISGDNKIEDCNVGILVDGAYASATIQNNDANIDQLPGDPDKTIELNDIGIDVAFGTASITNNSLANNDINIRVRDGGKVPTISANTLTGTNNKHFAFDVTADDASVVLSQDMFDREAADVAALSPSNTFAGAYIVGNMDGSGLVQAEIDGAKNYTFVRSSIQDSVVVADVSSTIYATAGKFLDNIVVNKQLRLSGAGIDVSTISPPIGNTAAAVRCATVSPSVIEGFTITREGNHASTWDVTQNPLSTAGVAVQGPSAANFTIRGNKFTGTRTAIDLNATSGNTIENNIIDFNRTGLVLRNGCPDNSIIGNEITDNWTMGVLWLDPTVADDSDPAPDATDTHFNGNYIDRNWFADVEVEELRNSPYVKDFSGNYFGSANAPTYGNANSSEPGYAALIPLEFGGTATSAIGTGLDINGAGVSDVDYNAWLTSGIDQDDDVVGFQADFSQLKIAAASPLDSGKTSHVGDAVELLANSDARQGGAREIIVTDGTYTDGVALVNKACTIYGSAVADHAAPLATFNPRANLQVGFDIQASNVTLRDIAISGLDASTVYSNAIKRIATSTPYEGTLLDNITVNYAGVDPTVGTGMYAVDLRGADAGSTIQHSTFTNCGYAGLSLWGPVTATVHNNKFDTMSYQGVYARYDNGYPLVTVTSNDFKNTPAAVRFNTVNSNSVVGGGLATNAATANNIELGATINSNVIPTLGVSIEYTPAIVTGNNFIAVNSATLANFGENIGVFVWKTATDATISGNVFTNVSGNVTGRAIVLEGLREGLLSNPNVPASNAAGATNAAVSGNEITGYAKGVVLSNAEASNQVVNASITGTNDFDGCQIGVELEGAYADASISNNTFASTLAGALHIKNNSDEEIDVFTNSFDGETPSAWVLDANLAKFWALQAKLEDKLNNSANGHLNLKNGYVFVPVSKNTPGVIGRGVEAADSGESVLVQEGPYSGDTLVNKYVQLLSKPLTPQAAAGTTGKFIVMIPAGTGTAGSGQYDILIDGFHFAGLNSGIEAVGQNTLTNSKLGITNNVFGMTNAAFAGANVMNATVKYNKVFGGGFGLVLLNSTDSEISNNEVTETMFTGIGVVKSERSPQVISSDITIADNKIRRCGMTQSSTTDSGLDFTSEGGYGILVGAEDTDSNTVVVNAPFASDITVKDNEITSNSATGIFLSHLTVADTQYPNLVQDNTVTSNGLSGESATLVHNTDGVKIIDSTDVVMAYNTVTGNKRFNVLVSGDTANATAGDRVVINYNRINGSEAVDYKDNLGNITPNLKAGLALQLNNAVESNIDATNNWWGHAYGPEHPTNIRPNFTGTIGRGEIVLEGTNDEASVLPYYGERSYVQRWKALNDRDGDGLLDEEEDPLLATVGDTLGAPGVKDTDSDDDGYEDGVEIALGWDATVKYSADPAKHPAHPMQAYAATNTNDTDGDGYYDYYEVAFGSNPNDNPDDLENPVHDVPQLGNVDGDAEVAGSMDVSRMRQVIVLNTSIYSKTPYMVMQDNMDLNRDGNITNIDAIALRRKSVGSITLPIGGVNPVTP